MADYVVKNTRGKAVALTGVGLVGGEVTAMGVLFQFTKDLSFERAFAITSVVVLGWSIFILIAIKDPDLKSLRTKMDRKVMATDERLQETSPEPLNYKQSVNGSSVSGS